MQSKLKQKLLQEKQQANADMKQNKRKVRD